MEKENWQKKGEGHRQRLRDRFLERGLDGFSEIEILELLLSFGTPRSDCKEPARDALKRYGSLAAVLEVSLASLQEVKGIGPKNAFAVHFIQAVARYYLKERLKGKHYLHSSTDVRDYLIHALRGLKNEILTVIYLDSSHAILDTETVAEGTINVNTVYPRELVKKALLHNAAAIIIAHNHPSGSLEPSLQDMELTRTLFLLGSMMQIKVLDHLIIGEGSFSFADNNLMTQISDECRNTMESLHSSVL
ncbi:DNA repair protein RadC [Methanococcoides sp. SA1]|nr:DNA repair protein RadC [Methanococcoides sp. SA1]